MAIMHEGRGKGKEVRRGTCSKLLRLFPEADVEAFIVSLVSRLSHHVTCTCSTDVGEDLLKLVTCSDVHGHWVGVWRSGTFWKMTE